jgi:hypothetical protein
MKITNRRYNLQIPLQPDISDRGPSGTPQQREYQALANQPGVSPIDSSIANFLRQIAENSNIANTLQTIGLGFTPRLVTILPANGPNPPTPIVINNQAARGYIIQNPGELSGFSSQVTFFPSLLRVPAVYTSASFNVSGVETARAFLNVTVFVAGATLTVDAETQDPLSGGWAISQADIFSGSVAVGTYYANIGPLGVDQNIRLVATVGVSNLTFSISGLLKGISASPVGSTVYIGGQDVNTTFGFSILPGGKEYLFLRENVSLYGITAVNSLALKVFQLQ